MEINKAVLMRQIKTMTDQKAGNILREIVPCTVILIHGIHFTDVFLRHYGVRFGNYLLCKIL